MKDQYANYDWLEAGSQSYLILTSLAQSPANVTTLLLLSLLVMPLLRTELYNTCIG